MSIVDNLMTNIVKRKHSAETGEFNCIPFAIPTLRNVYPGIERGRYIICTGATKAGKTQCTNFMILYNSIEYAYAHPDQIHVKFLYFPLEEDAQTIIARYLSYCLYRKFGVVIEHNHLMSSNTDNPLSDDELKLVNDSEIQERIRFFESCIEFHEENSSIGILKAIKTYVDNNGTTEHEKDPVEIDGKVVHLFKSYTPNDDKLYLFALIDHVGLIQPNSQEGKIMSAIENLSKGLVKYKNRYKLVAVVVQQQVDSETTGLDAIRTGNILATKSGLKDCKSSGNDCTELWGISNPGMFPTINEWSIPGTDVKYDLNRFRRKHLRVFSIILNRFGEGDIYLPLFFVGGCNHYEPLPSPNDEEGMKRIDEKIENLRPKVNKVKSFMSFTKKDKSIINQIKQLIYGKN